MTIYIFNIWRDKYEMDESDLIYELNDALKHFLDELYNSLTKKVDYEKLSKIENENSNEFNLAAPIRNEKKYQIPKNLLSIDYSVFNKLVIKIDEGANFPYKTRGKRNTLVTIKLHPDLPNFVSKISENHTKHAIYDSNFEVNISKVNMTQLIPIIFVFDKSMKTGELELLGLHYIELQKVKVIEDKIFVYNDEWIDIYTKETRNYNGSLKATIYFTDIKEETTEIIEKINKKRERVSPNPNSNSSKKEGKFIEKHDEEVQTEEYFDEISPEKIDGNRGDFNFNMIHNKTSRFIFIDDDKIMNDDFVYKSDRENLDIEKILFQDEVDDQLADLLEPSIKYENVESMKNRTYNPEKDENDFFLFDQKKYKDEFENELLVKKMIYNSEKYSSYSDFKWNYGYDEY